MKHKMEVKWLDNMAFEADMGNHKIVMDAKPEVGGEDKGPTPKPLMLTSLGGCTGMDVVSILKKMRVEVDDFKIFIEGDVTEEHPKHYNKMHVIYQFKGKNLPREKLEKAVNLSQERYCGVSEVYKKAMEFTSEIQVLEE